MEVGIMMEIDYRILIKDSEIIISNNNRSLQGMPSAELGCVIYKHTHENVKSEYVFSEEEKIRIKQYVEELRDKADPKYRHLEKLARKNEKYHTPTPQ